MEFFWYECLGTHSHFNAIFTFTKELPIGSVRLLSFFKDILRNLIIASHQFLHISFSIEFVFLNLLPRNLTWNLKMMVSKRNLLFWGLLFRFHVKFRGCKLPQHSFKSKFGSLQPLKLPTLFIVFRSRTQGNTRHHFGSTLLVGGWTNPSENY